MDFRNGSHLEVDESKINYTLLLVTDSNLDKSSSKDERWNFTWFEVFILFCSSFGIIGNCLNLLVLTRRRMMAGLDQLGRTANYGLIALAVSDFLFCCAAFPSSFAKEPVNKDALSTGFYYYYGVFGIALINLFTMTSTWLIVMLAIKRLLVVREPLRARGHLTCRRTILSICAVFLASVCWTLPYFLYWKVIFDKELNLYTVTYIWTDTIHEQMMFFVRWVWPLLACFLPLVILVACTVGLLRELRKIFLTRRHRFPGQPVRHTSNRVTFTLAATFMMMLLLSLPAEFLKYFDLNDHSGKHKLAMEVANCLQAVNFATNFLLYCSVDATFRQTFFSVVYSCHDQRSGAKRSRKRRHFTLSARPCLSSSETGMFFIDRSRRSTREETELLRSGHRLKEYIDMH